MSTWLHEKRYAGRPYMPELHQHHKLAGLEQEEHLELFKLDITPLLAILV